MIVYPAYAYLKKSEPPGPADIFTANQVNYPYQGTATLTDFGFALTSNKNLKFTGVDCSNRTKIDISGSSSAIGFQTPLTVTIESGSQVAATISIPPSGTYSRSVEIPATHRTKNVNIIFSTKSITGELLLKSATLV